MDLYITDLLLYSIDMLLSVAQHSVPYIQVYIMLLLNTQVT